MPHRPAFGGLREADREAVSKALHRTDLADLTERPINAPSGGQVQRTWLAMVIAQGAPVLLLDEPTNHLDLSNALETLALVKRLVREEGRTAVIVLHDLNLAASFADRIVLFAGGIKRAEGTVNEVLQPQTIRQVFDVEVDVLRRPDADLPLIVPRLTQPERQAINEFASA